MPDHTPNLPDPAAGSDDVIAGLARIPTGTLCDVLDSLGIVGWLPSAMRRVSAGRQRFAGRAYTISWQPVRKQADIKGRGPSTWSEVAGFLAPGLGDAAGRVYVAGAGPLLTEMALAGGLSTTSFQVRGFAGVVLGGAVRDADVVSDLALPVVATGFTPADTQGCYLVRETGTRCLIGDIVVETGDCVVSDQSGTVVIPAAHAAAVLAAGAAIEGQEAAMMERIRRGDDLHAIIEKEGRI